MDTPRKGMLLVASGLCISVVAGCAQILGLEKTNRNGVDAPGICDEPLMCTVDGSELCGRLIGVGTAKVRTDSPSGAICDATMTDGPCALTVMAQAKAAFFGGMPTMVPATVDDCGRFKLIGLPSAAPVEDVAILVTGPSLVATATIARDRVATGTKKPPPVRAPAVPMDAATAWFTDGGIAPLATGVYLTQFPLSTATERSNWNVLLDGAKAVPQTTAPYTFYFGNPALFDKLDPSLTKSGPSGTALVEPKQSPFALSGQRTGKACDDINGLVLVPNFLIFVDQTGC
jgi:hypothetical protein